MREAELDHGSQRSTRNAGQKRPGGLRVCMPKASAREFHQSNRPRLVNALLVLRKHSRVLHHRRAFADCFGANSVASALGSSTRRDPGAADRTYHGWSRWPLKTGTFYFAGKRNFLLCRDRLIVRGVAHPGLTALATWPCPHRTAVPVFRSRQVPNDARKHLQRRTALWLEVE